MNNLDILDKDVINLLDKNNSLKKLIKQELQTQIINNVEIDATTIENVKKFFMQNEKLSNEEELDNWLKIKSMNQEIFLDRLLQPIKINKYSSENFGHQVHSHFLSRKSALDQIIYSLLRVKDFYVAKELYLRLQSNEENFASLAKQYSEGNEKHTMGIMGPVAIDQAHPLLTNVLKKSKIGEISEPFKVNEFWVIVRTESFIEAILDKQMETNMANELFTLYIEEESEIIKQDLLKKSSHDQNDLRVLT